MKALLKYALRNLWRMKFRSLALFAVLFLLSAAAVVGLISARSTASEAERIRLKTPVTVTVQPRAAEAKTNEEGGAMQEANPNVTIADVQTLLRSPYVKDCGVHIPALYGALGIYLPLITTNCAVLGVVLLNIDKGYGFAQSMFNSVGAGLGFMLAMVMFAGVRERMESCDIPKFMQGLPITLVAASLVSVSFLGFTGIVETIFG